MHGHNHRSSLASCRRLTARAFRPLTHLTTLTLRSLPTELGGLGIRRYSGLAGEIAYLLARPYRVL
jgi:hypothetical protein